MTFRGSIPHPMQSLCTLRDQRRRWPRNTRYQGGAAPYLDRSSTGWIAPACLAHSLDHLSVRARSVAGMSRPSAVAVLRFDHQLEFNRLLDRDVGRLCTAQELVDKLGGATPK